MDPCPCSRNIKWSYPHQPTRSSRKVQISCVLLAKASATFAISSLSPQFYTPFVYKSSVLRLVPISDNLGGKCKCHVYTIISLRRSEQWWDWDWSLPSVPWFRDNQRHGRISMQNRKAQIVCTRESGSRIVTSTGNRLDGDHIVSVYQILSNKRTLLQDKILFISVFSAFFVILC